MRDFKTDYIQHAENEIEELMKGCWEMEKQLRSIDRDYARLKKRQSWAVSSIKAEKVS